MSLASFLDEPKKTRLTKQGEDFVRLNCYDKALECYTQILSIDPKDAKAWDKKGVCLGGLGRLEDAMECLEKAVEISPNFEAAWCHKNLILGKILCSYEKQEGLYDSALDMLYSQLGWEFYFAILEIHKNRKKPSKISDTSRDSK